MKTYIQWRIEHAVTNGNGYYDSSMPGYESIYLARVGLFIFNPEERLEYYFQGVEGRNLSRSRLHEFFPSTE